MFRWDTNLTYWSCTYPPYLFGDKKAVHKEKHLLPLWNMVVVHDVLLLVKIDGILNSTKYQEILAQNLVASARRIKLGPFGKITTPNTHQNTYRKDKIKVLQWLWRSEPYWKPVVCIKQGSWQAKPQECKGTGSVLDGSVVQYSSAAVLQHCYDLSAAIRVRGGFTKYQ